MTEDSAMQRDSVRQDKLMQDYYAARAAEYDQIYLKPERQNDLRQIESWLASALAGRRVLEIACGTAYWTRFFAPTAKQVVALDAASETLQIARHRVRADHVAFLQGDAYRIPSPDVAWSAAFAGFWWSHIPVDRIGEFLGGLGRVLEPGAKVIFLDNRYVVGSSTPIAEQDPAGNTYQIRRLADGSHHRVLKNFPDKAQLLAAVEPYAAASTYHQWEYFWGLEYLVSA